MNNTSLATRPRESLDQLLRLADILKETGLLGSRTPGTAVAVMLIGRELGIPPMHALRTINIIDGRPTLAAELQLALFLRAGGRYEWRESTDHRASIWLRHPNGSEHLETYTVNDAQRAKLTNKTNWQLYGRFMLRARCASGGLRAIAPDIQLGLYDPSEITSLSPVRVAPLDKGDKDTETPEAVDALSETSDMEFVNDDPSGAWEGYEPKDEDELEAILGMPSRPGIVKIGGEDKASPRCPKCGSDMRDERSTRRNPRAPDYRCRDLACKGVVWPTWDPEQRTASADPTPTPPPRTPEIQTLPEDDPYAEFLSP